MKLLLPLFLVSVLACSETTTPTATTTYCIRDIAYSLNAPSDSFREDIPSQSATASSRYCLTLGDGAFFGGGSYAVTIVVTYLGVPDTIKPFDLFVFDTTAGTYGQVDSMLVLSFIRGGGFLRDRAFTWLRQPQGLLTTYSYGPDLQRLSVRLRVQWQREEP